MIKEHKICSMVIKVDSNVLIEFLNDMIADFRTLKDLHARLTEYKAGEMEEDEFEDYMLDVRFLSTNSFHNLSKLFICENQSINIYFSRTAYTFTDLTDLCSAISDRYCAPNEKETDSLLDLCYKTLAGFCFMLGNEFGCYQTVLSKDEEEQVYDEILYNHFMAFSPVAEERYKMCMDFAEDVVATSKEFKIQLDVFDAAPEKEAAFMNIVGPDIGAIDESALTMKMVDDLLAGDITVEQLLSMCLYTEIDDAAEETVVSPRMIEV